MEPEEIRHARNQNLTALIVIGILIALVLALGVHQHITHRFTTEKWLAAPEERGRLVDDLLEKHPLMGMDMDEVFALLGEETSVPHENGKNFFYYYLGPERGLISIDSEWLVLTVEKNLVTAIDFATD